MDTVFELLHEINAYSTAFRIFLAVLLGGMIGLERGHHGRAAGLRTHILVCLGAAMASLIGLYTASVLDFDNDPLRVGAQVVSGIGFLGVGTIMTKNQQQVTGLTTAAGLWATASIGLAIGIGYYVAAFLGFLAVVITMAIFVYLERAIKGKTTYTCYVELSDVEKVNSFFDEIKPLIRDATVIPAKSGILSHVGLEIKVGSLTQYEQVIKKARQSDLAVIALPTQN